MAGSTLRQALDLYRGDFLSDFYLEDSNQFEAWTEAVRESYRQKLMGLLATLGDINLHNGDHNRAIGYIKRQLALDPLHEPAHRQLMRIYDQVGQRAAALRQYQICQQTLENELGATPSQESSHLYEHIRNKDLSGEAPRGKSLSSETANPPAGTVTFLFTDIQSSTPLWESQPEKMAAALKIHNAVLDQAIGAHGGMVFKTVGDSFQAAFATAPKALDAAIQGQRNLQEAPWNELGELKVRMGLHTGEAQLDPGGDEYAVSHTKNRAARIMSAAHGGQVLLSQETKELVDHQLPKGVTLKDLDKHRLKGMELQEHLYQVIAPELERNFPPLRTETHIRHNLPAQPTSFIGREKELADLDALLADPQIRMVTIVGPGGIGKTRLAVAAAAGVLDDQRFPDGVFFVDLSPVAEPDRIASATAEALSLRLQGDANQTLKQQLLDYLQSERVLLLLDNFEHLLDGVELVADLLAEAPGVQVLATSRERLHLRMEQVYPIEGLAFPDWETPEDAAQYTAVRLFLQSAQRNQPDFSLRDGNDLTYLARICRLVAGMPLALELAASWVDMLPLSKIAAGLQEGLDLLETEMRDMPVRHHSVRATIDHSWKLLGEEEREIFAKLSVFRGGFTRESAREVASASLQKLGQFVNKSFLKYDPGSDRYQVHELMRQYGAEKLSDVESVRTRHLGFFLMFAEQTETGFVGPEPEKWVGLRNAEIDNVRAALDWTVESGQAQSGLKLGAAYGFYWLSHDFREGRRWLDQLLALPRATEATQGRAVALGWAGHLASQLGDFESGITLSEESISISRTLGGMGKLSLGWALIDNGAQLSYRDVAKALQAVEEGIVILRQTGEPWQLCYGLTVRGWLAYMQGNSAQASAFTNESLALARKNNYKWQYCTSMRFLGMQLYNQGDYDSARAYLEEALLIRDSVGDTWFERQLLGAIALLQGDLFQAVAYFEGALAEHRQLGSKMHIARALSDLGIAIGHLGDHSRTADLIHEALLLNQDVTSEHEIGICLLGAAGVQKSPRSGALLLGASWATLEAAGEVIQPIYQAEKERIGKAVRAALGEEAFNAAYAEGQALSVDQAIAAALADSDDWIDGELTSFD